MAYWKNEERLDANRVEKDGCTRREVKGLVNLGNTCFFNAVMQNLLVVDGLRDYFMKPEQFPEGPITSALRNLFNGTSSEESQGDDIDNIFAWWSKRNQAVDPKVLFSAICAKAPQFGGFRQQDSHELLRCLLDNLHCEELQPTNCGDGEAVEGNTDESSNRRNTETLVDRVFQGQLCSTVCCSKCGYQSVIYEPFHDLSLPIPRKPESVKVSLPQIKDPSSSTTQFWNQWLEDSTAKSGFGLLGGSESPLPHKEMDYIADEELEGTKISAELNTDDPLEKLLGASRLTTVDSDDDIWNLFYDDQSSAVQENKIEVGESESLLYGETDGDNLFKDVPVTTETEEEREATGIPMSVDGCLMEFTRLELLSGENGWKCPNCASKIVNGCDNLEDTAAKEEQDMGFNGSLNARSGQNISDSIKDQSQVEKTNLPKRLKDTKLEFFTSARCLETSNTKTDEFQPHSGSVAGCEAGLNDNACQKTEVLCNLDDIDSDQLSKQEGHQVRRGFSGQDSVPVHDSAALAASCSYGEGHSKENERVFVAEDSSEIDGISHAENPPSTGSKEEGGRISANLEEWDLKPTKLRSSGGHTLKKRKSKTIEHEANSDDIVQEATKRYLISKAPPVLTIHLKRFQQNSFGSFSKFSGHVAFQERLDLRPYLDPRCPDKEECIYRLIGLVEHQGTMTMGHYVAYVRCDQDDSVSQWFHVSDSLVEEVCWRKVIQSQAYILFYEKSKL